MTPAQLSRTVLCTVRRAVEDGELRAPVPERAVVRRPPRPGCGDYATGIALQLAGPAGHPPRHVAEILRRRLAQAPGIAGVEIADPGFLNITLDPGSHTGLVRAVLTQGPAYGHGDALAGRHVELAFARETRAAVTADSLARILRTQGAAVTTRCAERPDPLWAQLGVTVDGYGPGSAEAGTSPIARPRPTSLAETGAEADPQTDPRTGAQAGAEADAQTGAEADAQTGAESGAETAPETSPQPAHPHRTPVRPVPVKATPAALLRALGPDATRWALLRPAAHDHPRTAPDDLLTQRESNPFFRVRYAHARARALLRNAAELGFGAETAGAGDPGHPGAALDDLLAALAEYPAVLAAAARHRAPDRVARHLETTADAFFRFHDTCPVLPRGDEKPAAAHRSRLALAQAAGTVLAGGLHLLGVHAPVHL